MKTALPITFFVILELTILVPQAQPNTPDTLSKIHPASFTSIGTSRSKDAFIKESEKEKISAGKAAAAAKRNEAQRKAMATARINAWENLKAEEKNDEVDKQPESGIKKEKVISSKVPAGSTTKTTVTHGMSAPHQVKKVLKKKEASHSRMVVHTHPLPARHITRPVKKQSGAIRKMSPPQPVRRKLNHKKHAIASYQHKHQGAIRH